MAIALGYLDLDQLKDALSITDTTDDARLEMMIETASRLIDGACKRPDGDFLGQTLTRYYDVGRELDQPIDQLVNRVNNSAWLTGGGGAQRITVDPLLTVTTLKTDAGGDGTFETTWATTDYLLYPLNLPVKREIVVDPINGRYTFPIGLKRVQIVGTWGDASAAPMMIQTACMLLATRYFKRPEAPFGVLGAEGVGFIRLTAVDPDIQTLLEQGGFVNQWLVA